MFSGFNDFKHIMKAKRDADYVTCEIGCLKHSSNLHDVNHFVKRHAYHGLGDQWNAVDEQTARNLMTYLRSKDLAYECPSPSLLNYAIISYVIFRMIMCMIRMLMSMFSPIMLN